MKRWVRQVDKRLLALVTSLVAGGLVAIVVVAAMPGGLTVFRGKPVAAAHKPAKPSTSCTPAGLASAPFYSLPTNSYYPPVASNPYYPPVASNPYYPPVASNPYYPPVASNPYYPPAPTNPYYPPVPTNPYYLEPSTPYYPQPSSAYFPPIPSSPFSPPVATGLCPP